MGTDPLEIEREVRRLAAAGDRDGATTMALRHWGPEVLSLLAALHRDENAAAEVFSWFAEGVWRGVLKFEWQCALRTWLYAIARRCSLRFQRDGRRRAAREAPLPEGSSASLLAQKLRTQTASYLRTERRSRIAALRDALPIEDQTLLMLRVDRELAWNELAHVLGGGEETPLDDATLKREAARLRKRFQLVKERLHALAKEQGLA